MYRQYLVVIVVAAVAFLLAMGAVEHWKRLEMPPGAPQPSAPGLARPNVVLIVLDALRADRVDAARDGKPVMPKLARYARENVRFTNAVAPCTWTRPSMASILTSLYVDTHQVYYGFNFRNPNSGPDDHLPASCESLATFLKNAGYRTAAIQSNANCAASLGFAQGFDRYDELTPVPANVVTDHALQQLGQDAASPFFLYVHYIDPHIPYQPPEPYRKLFGFPPAIPANELKIVTDFMDYFWDHIDHVTGNIPQRRFPELSPEAKEAVRTLYDGEARFLDDELARLLAAIRTKAPNTIVVILADHGEHFWEHGRLGHGLTEYSEELDVPLMLSGPGLMPKTVDTLVETIDIAPTLASLLHMKANPRWQGVDLFSRRKDRPAFSRTRGSWPTDHIDLDAIALGSFRLILNNATGQAELYDVAADPGEQHNIADDHAAETGTLKTMLLKHRQDSIQARQSVQAVPNGPIDPALVEQLKSLGYVK